MAAKFVQWNTEAYTLGGVVANRGQDVYQYTTPSANGHVYSNPPKFQEDLNADEE